MSKILRWSTIPVLIFLVFSVSSVIFIDSVHSTEPTGTLSSVSPATDIGSSSVSESQPPSGVKSRSKFQLITYIVPALGVLGLLFTLWKSRWVSTQDVGTERMARIADNITDGAMSFLKAEYSILFVFVLAVAALLGFAGSQQGDLSSPLISLSFVLGAFCSALAGFIGMRVATKANVRTTQAARGSLGKALEVAFAGGSVMGMGVVGLGPCSGAVVVQNGVNGPPVTGAVGEEPSQREQLRIAQSKKDEIEKAVKQLKGFIPFYENKNNVEYNSDKEKFFIKTLEGDHLISEGDYIIKGVKGEFYPCKPDIFESTYEKV